MIVAVPPDQLDTVWESVEPLAYLAAEHSHGDLDVQKLKQRILNGEDLLLIYVENGDIMSMAVCTKRILDGGDLVLHVPVVGGERMKEWLTEGMEIIRQIARDAGCAWIMGMGRPGWSKVIPEAKTVYTLYRFEV